MSDPDSSLETKHFGIEPEQKAEKDNLIRIAHKEIDQQRKTEALPAKLSESERGILNRAEHYTRKFFLDKFVRLDLKPPANFATYPAVIYTQHAIKHFDPETRLHIGTSLGTYASGASFAAVAIDRLRDLLATAQTAAHELSHASGKQQWRIQWSEGNLAHLVDTVGLDRRNREKRYFAGLENGLSLLDTVDIYYLYHQKLFPKEARLRKKIVTDQTITKDVRDLGVTAFGRIPTEIIEPFTSVVEIVKNHQKTTRVQIHSDAIRNYRFIQEVCRTLGFTQAQQSGYEDASDKKLVEVGRYILEKDRYTGSTVGLKMLVHTFGQQRARLLFSVDDRYLHLDEAMQAVRDTQKELGI